MAIHLPDPTYSRPMHRLSTPEKRHLASMRKEARRTLGKQTPNIGGRNSGLEETVIHDSREKGAL